MSLCGCFILTIWLSGGGLRRLLVFFYWVVLRGWVHVCLCMCLFLSVYGCKTSKVLLVRVCIWIGGMNVNVFVCVVYGFAWFKLLVSVWD